MTAGLIGKYTLGSVISRTEQTVVYHAGSQDSERPLVIKVFSKDCLHDPTIRARYQREAQIIASLAEKAIVPVLDFGEQDEQLFIVMPWMPGGSLEDRLQDGPLSPEEAIRILKCLAPALDAVNQFGILHGNLKPANILFDEQDQACLTDFGTLKLSEAAQLAGQAVILGPPAYISPEQATQRQELEAGSDRYMMAVIFYQMLTGELPYHAETPLGYAVHHIAAPIPSPLAARPELHAGFEAVMMRALAKDPQARFSSASEMVAACGSLDKQTLPRVKQVPLPLPDRISQDVITPHLVVRQTPRPTGHAPKKRKRFPALAGALLLLMLLVAGGGILGARYLGYELPWAAQQRLESTPPSTIQASQPIETLPAPTAPQLEAQPENSPAQLSADQDPAPTAPIEPTPEMEPVMRSPATEYVFRSGDMLFDLAGQYQVNWLELLNLNNLDCTSRPPAGVTLQIPASMIYPVSPASGTLEIANIDQWVLKHQFECLAEVSALAISPDGTILAAASGEMIYLWQTGDWRPLRSLKGHIATIHSIDFSPDGQFIASASEDTSVRLWKVDDGSLVATLYGHTTPVVDAAFSPDGATLVTVAPGDSVAIWQTNSYSTPTNWLKEKEGLSVAFSSTGDKLAIGRAAALDVYSYPQLALLQSFSSLDPNRDIAFSPDDTLVASSSDIWHIVEGRHIYDLGSGMDGVVFTPDGQMLITGKKLWRISNGLSLGEIPDLFASIQRTKSDHDSVILSPDGKSLYWGSKGGLTVWGLPGDYQEEPALDLTEYVVQPGDTIFSIANAQNVKLDAFLTANQLTCDSLIFSNQRLLIPNQAEDLLPFYTDPLPVIAAETVDQVEQLSSLAMTCNLAASDLIFSTDGKKLISGSALWYIPTGSIVAQDTDIPLKLDGKPETNLRSPLLALSNDQKTLAMRSGNHILLWELETGHLISDLGSHQGPVSTLVFSPDDQYLVSGSVVNERAIRLWRVSDGKLMWFHEGYGVQQLTYTPDGKMLIVEADDTVRFWGVGENKPDSVISGLDSRMEIAPDYASIAFVTCLEKLGQSCSQEVAKIFSLVQGIVSPFVYTGVEKLVKDLQFAPDGESMAGATGNGVTLWNIEDSVVKHWLVVPNDASPVKMVQFSPDGSLLISVNEKNTLRFWRVSDGELLTSMNIGEIERFSFSPDGTMFAILSDGVISLWGAAQ